MEEAMDIYSEISESLQKGRVKQVEKLVQRALTEGSNASDALNNGLIAGMDIIGVKFKNNKIFVPEVMIAARAMKAGMEILKPYLAESGQKPIGKILIGTVKGDLHDIGKNLVRMMIESKGVEAVDLGVDVSAEKFLEAYQTSAAPIICCSALLTTTMGEMKRVVEIFTNAGVRDKVSIFIGGAPITDNFRKSIGADYYAPDAATASETVKRVLIEKYQ
jgi:5-methyltetrahydrofolate--homocysteine methyltransferase